MILGYLAYVSGRTRQTELSLLRNTHASLPIVTSNPSSLHIHRRRRPPRLQPVHDGYPPEWNCEHTSSSVSRCSDPLAAASTARWVNLTRMRPTSQPPRPHLRLLRDCIPRPFRPAMRTTTSEILRREHHQERRPTHPHKQSGWPLKECPKNPPEQTELRRQPTWAVDEAGQSQSGDSEGGDNEGGERGCAGRVA